MNNSTLFATFVSQVFTELYDNFPIPSTLRRQEIIENVQSHDEFWNLTRQISTVTGMMEIMEAAEQMTPDFKVRAEQKQLALTTELKEKKFRIRQVEAVFDGTVDFLVDEGFIRAAGVPKYQLTLKGFTHLNKRFGQVGITDGPSLIEKLRDSLRPENFSGAVTAGTLATLIAKVFGG